MENTCKDFCQSCGMPLSAGEEVLGTNKDGSLNKDYCVYCFKDGAFTSNATMEEMIEICVPHMVNDNKSMTEEEARKIMYGYFPSLKRWQK